MNSFEGTGDCNSVNSDGADVGKVTARQGSASCESSLKGMDGGSRHPGRRSS